MMKNIWLDFQIKKKIDFYGNKKTSEGVFEILTEEDIKDKNGEYVKASVDGEVYKYRIEKVSQNELALMYLPRGNVLRFKK